MPGRDQYYNRAKQEGYRTRSAYKLKQLDEEAGLFSPGETVVDLGAAPGGWLQVAAEAVGAEGRVVGVDRQRIRDLDADVETVRGDITDERTKDAVREAIDAGGADVVVSDMAPNMTGEYTVDHARSVHLVRQAFEVARDLLVDGGDFVAKVFDGPDLAALREDLESEFDYVREVRPDASRDSSSELYLVCKRRLSAPVSVGDELTVDVVDTGREGDGVARVDGFAVFVDGAEEGESARVRITDVKRRFAFAERVDRPAE